MSKVKLKVVLEEPEDWFHWSKVVESYFKYNELWDIVTGERKLTETATEAQKKISKKTRVELY